MGIKELVGAAVFFAVAGLFLWMIVTNVRGIVSGRSAKGSTVDAEVIKKTSSPGSGAFGENGLRAGKTVYSAEFSSDGESLEFEMSEDEWKKLSEGDRGQLSYRGKQYLGFYKDSLSGTGESE